MKEFELKLSQDQIEIIGKALMELPAKLSLNVINNINRQLQVQLDEDKKNNEK